MAYADVWKRSSHSLRLAVACFLRLQAAAASTMLGSACRVGATETMGKHRECADCFSFPEENEKLLQYCFQTANDDITNTQQFLADFLAHIPLRTAREFKTESV